MRDLHLPHEYSVKLSANDWELIGRALGELPLKESYAPYQSIRAQVIQQNEEAAAAAVAKASEAAEAAKAAEAALAEVAALRATEAGANS